jgi:hypothetical protein
MSVSPQTLPNIDSSAAWAGTYTYKYNTSNSSYHWYGLYDNNNTLTNEQRNIKVEIATDTWSDAGSMAPVAPVLNSDGTISLFSSGILLYKFTKPTTASWISSGPTVTSITVANSVSNTRNFTVTHTGTLSASDIKYFIDGSDITSLGSPNTPITNLQTTSTGSTFDSYTVQKYGQHSVHIGNQKLIFPVTLSTSTTYDARLTNNGITVSWPSSDSAWLSSFNYTTKSTSSTNRYIYLNKETTDSLGDVTSGETLVIDTKYTSPSFGQYGYYIAVMKYDLLTPSNSSIAETYWDPVVNLSYTWNPSPASSYQLSNSFVFDFATQQSAPPNTTVRGTNAYYPQRYPLISTNLFNRQRSVYAIGMTHKDTWDLFI